MPGEEGHFPAASLEGLVEDDGVRSYVGTSGIGIYEQLVAPNPQVFMVLGGHDHKVPGEGTDTYDGEYRQVSSSQGGHRVYEMLANYQAYPNGGDGWLRTVTFEAGYGASRRGRRLTSQPTPAAVSMASKPS